MKSLRWSNNSKEKGQSWKIEKKDGPDPGTYTNDKSKDFVSKKSSGFGFSKGKRNFYTTEASKKAAESPGAGQYTVNDSKIHKKVGHSKPM